MDYYRLHPWDVDVEEAKAIQIRLRKRYVSGKGPEKIERIAAADQAYSQKSNWVYGVVAVFDYPTLSIIEVKHARMRVKFPYAPGFLAFREGPCLLEAFKKIKSDPEVVIFDGHGLAHPAGMGIATHLGILLDKPTIGCAKSRLIGEYQAPPRKVGSYSYLLQRGTVIGSVLRTKTNVKPVFVSGGYKVDLESSIRVVLECCRKYRIPEPLRQVHMLAQQLVRLPAARLRQAG